MTAVSAPEPITHEPLPDTGRSASPVPAELGADTAPALHAPPPPVLSRGQLLFRTLGAAEIHIGAGPVVGPSAERLFTLLVLTAMTPDHVLPRAQLLELVWPDLDEEGARHSLRQHLYKLKQLGVPLSTTRSTVTLDARCLVPCFALGRTSELFDRDVLRGHEPFGHLFAGWIPSSLVMRRWVEQQRDRFHMDVRRILLPELHRLRDRADWVECERWARTVLEFDPYNEDATLVLAEAIAMLGGRVNARYMLDGYVRETGVAGTDLARHVEAAQRRIGRASRVRHEHSATPTLIGRDAELQRLDALTMAAMQGESKVVHLLGPTGIGKTELAYEATRRAVILGFSRCIVRVTRPMGEVPHGMLSRLVRDLLKLPGALGCRPGNVELLQAYAGMTIAEDGPATRSAAPSSIAEALCDLIGSITFEQPVLIFLDDVHLADSHSRYILETTWDFIRGHRLLMVITELSPASDHVEEPENSDVRQTLSLGALSLAQATKLATLVSSPSGRRLNEEVAALVATASDRTPLDVVTLSREHLVTGITAPEKRSLVDTLVAQLLRLPPRARALTQAVALLGGRASPGVVATVLEIPLCDRLDALAVLLDAGILKETENGAVCCHHEVSQAALRTLREPEANVLRRGLALAFDGLLAESFSPDYAVSMLSLALDSKDASLFTRLCISHARSLARTGMARGAVRFLESALRVSTAPEITHSLLAVLADVAQHEAHWRGVLNATRAMCALPSHKESPLSIELQLSGLEGLIHTSLHTEGLSCGHAAQRVAEDHSLAPGLRTRAARIALTAASELFDVHLGMAANSVVEELSQAYPDDELSLREPRMQYHTIFGSLNTAELEALSILSHAAEHARTAAGLRALINASAVLRISGKSTLALDCLDACASSPLLLGNASRRADIAWRRCVIALDAEHRSEAIARYGELRASLTESGEEGELWARLFALRMELVTNGDIRDVSAALRVTEEGRFHPNRLMLYCCALCLNSSQFRARDSEYASMLRRGTQWLLEFGRYSGLDFLAASVLGRLEAGGDPRHAAEAADRYFRIDRRERSPIGVAFEALSPSLRVHIAEASS